MKRGIDNQAGWQAEGQTERMRRYLLGALPEGEQLALERDFFADSATLDELRAVESDLIDAYVRGRLDDGERHGFERHYLSTPGHSERVAFARALLRAADEASAVEEQPADRSQPREVWWVRLLASWRAPQFALGAMAMALLLLTLGGSWLIRQKVNWNNRLSHAQAERLNEQDRARALAAEVVQGQERNAQLNAELERLHQQGAQATPAPAPRSAILSFLLLSGVRGGEQRTLRLHSTVEQVRLLMKIERGDWQRYQASIRPLVGGASWSPTDIKASSGRNAATIAVTISVRRLPPGDYILTLTGVAAAAQTAESQEIDRYFFRVSR